jgi:hypothetical protein
MTRRAAPTLPSLRQIRFASQLRQCDGQGLKHLTEAALIWLQTNQAAVNALNVFPIPDGDTGTNMLLTMQAAYKEIALSEETNVGRVAHAIAHGALMGARGNSGVILSQIWRGFARSLDNVDTFDADLLVRAMHEACETAYRGVVKPVEGTILTVIKDVAAALRDAQPPSTDLRTLLEQAVTAAAASVARTPDLLPVLKEAGVVDSGGKGLTFVLEGMLRHLRGQPLDQPVDAAVAPLNLSAVGAAMEAVEPGQEWETVVDFRPGTALDLPRFYARLETLGTSIQVGEGDGIYRVHVHLLRSRRHEPVELAEELGTVLNVHMENLLAQMSDLQAGAAEEPLPLTPVAPGELAVIAVSPGPGLSRIMASLGAAAIVTGGQTMNPSTQDLLEAINGLPTDQVIVLPNNGNIILAARQAAELAAKQVRVIPTRSVPQGVAALLNFLAGGDLDETSRAMERSAQSVATGEVTTATRSVALDGVAVKDGQIIGLLNDVLKVAGDDLPAVVLSLLEQMEARQHALVDVYYGADVSAAQADTLAAAIRTAYPAQQVEVHHGGQPFYFYILSASE